MNQNTISSIAFHNRKERVIKLRDPDLDDPTLFHEIIKEASELFNLVPAMLARRFRSSRARTMRWIAGTAAPYPLMRKPVYQMIKELAKLEEVGIVRIYENQ